MSGSIQYVFPHRFFKLNEYHYGVEKMEQYDYKHILSSFNPEKTLRQVEKYERDGWTLYFLRPTLGFFFGCGGAMGMTAVMRRSRVRDTNATDES